MKKVKCLCGCGEEFSPINNRKYASPACAKRVKAMKSLKRKCRYCDNTPPGKRKVCLAPECQAKMKEDALERRRIAAKVRSDKEKMDRLRDNPVYCDHCGKPFGVKDKLQVPACHRPECVEWWEGEREVRRALRNDAVNGQRKARNGEPKVPENKKAVFIPREDDWSQEKFIEKLKFHRRPNGHTCLRDGCNIPTTGNYRFCEKHNEKREFCEIA